MGITQRPINARAGMIDLEAELSFCMRGADRTSGNAGRQRREWKDGRAPLGLPDANQAEGTQVPVCLSRYGAEPLVLIIRRDERQVAYGPNVRRIDLVRPAPHEDTAADLEVDVANRSLEIAFAQIPSQARAVGPMLELGATVRI